MYIFILFSSLLTCGSWHTHSAARNAVLPQDTEERGDAGLQLFGADDSQYSRDAFSGDDSYGRSFMESFTHTRGWAALKRSGGGRNILNYNGCDGQY